MGRCDVSLEVCSRYAGKSLTIVDTRFNTAHSAVLVPICLAAVLFAVFLVIEGRIASHPIIPLRVFTNLTSAGVLAVTFLLGSAY